MSGTQQETFGDLLRRLRQAAGLTQEELAERAAMSPRGISDLERGARRAPRRDTIIQLARALALDDADRALIETAARRRPMQPATASPPQQVAPPQRTTPPLVGREREQRFLAQYVAGNGPPVVMLAGEPGIGKSRLLHEAVAMARAQGWQVLTGGCSRRSGQEPFAPLLQAIAQHVMPLTPMRRREILRGCEWLVLALPELAADLPPLPALHLAQDQQRRLLFASITRLLEQSAGPQGTLLALDDLQWAGADVLDLLAHLIHSTGDTHPVRVLGAYRETELHAADPLAMTLADLGTAGAVHTVPLKPLSHADARTLLDALLAGASSDEQVADDDAAATWRERLVDRAGGLPFFLVSCAQEWELEGEASVGNVPDVKVPWNVAQSVRHRVAMLPESARSIVEIAAVIGRQVTRAMVVAVARQQGQTEEASMTALDAACRAHMLAEIGPQEYSFPHDLIREVIANDLGAAQRTLLHRRIAEVVEREWATPPVELLAYHFSHAGVAEKAITYLERAGDRAVTMQAYASAAEFFGDMAAHCTQVGAAHVAARAQEKQGLALHMLARYEAAKLALTAAADGYAAQGDQEGACRATSALGRVYADLGEYKAGLARLLPLLTSLEHAAPAPPPAGLAGLLASLAMLYFVSGHYVEQLEVAEKAIALARAAGDDLILADVERRRGLALVMLGRLNESLAAFEEAIAKAEALGDVATLCRGLDNISAFYRLRGDLQQSRQYVERALAAATQLNNPAEIAYVRAQRGEILFYLGEWQQARVDFEESAILERSLGASWSSVYTLLDLGELSLAEGDMATATKYLDQCVAAAEPSEDLQVLRQAQALLALRDVRQGEPEHAIARLLPLGDRAGQHEHNVTTFLPILANAYLALGDNEQAATIAAQAVERARDEQAHILIVDALQIHALVLGRQGHVAEALTMLDEVLASARAIPYPYGEGRALTIAAEILAAHGDQAQARQRITQALAILQRLGARTDSEHAVRMLATLLPET